MRLPNADAAVVFCCGEHLDDRCAENRMAETRRKFRERRQDEAALGHSRMRNFYLRCLDDAGPIKENVQIDNPRAQGNKFLAAEQALDSLQRLEQLLRRQRSLRLDYTIQEPRLLEK